MKRPYPKFASPLLFVFSCPATQILKGSHQATLGIISPGDMAREGNEGTEQRKGTIPLSHVTREERYPTRD